MHRGQLPTRRSGQAAELQQLRRLLVGPEQARLDQVESALPSAETVGHLLPEAMAHASQTRRDDLATSLEAPVNVALRNAARRTPEMFAEILAPAIGTAVRRAVAEAISAIMQRIDQLLERGLSLRSLRWRFEAKRSGRSYAEVVLAHTFVYRVEWVVLIHTESSLVLEQATAPDAFVEAPDQTSAMLQAINAFVSQALRSATPGGELEAIEVGDLKLWLEREPGYTIAVAIRGTAPASLRELLRKTLEEVLTLHPEVPRVPDTTKYADTHPLLEDCLQLQHVATPKRARWLLALAAVATVLSAVWLAHRSSIARERDDHMRVAYQRAFAAEPGFVVTSLDRVGGFYRIKGLRDPRATPAMAVIARAGLPPILFELAPFDSLDPHFERPLAAADAAIRELERVELAFEVGKSSIASDDPQVLRAVELVGRAQRAAAIAGAALCVEVLGDTDGSGGPERNDALRVERATEVVRVLDQAGIRRELLAPRAGDPLRERSHARRVTFRAELRAARPGGCP